MKKRQPNPIDVYIGKKIREARVLHGLSQTALARALGITFQQLQKYENAHNRVSCSRLFAISRTLGIPVQAFFAGAKSAESGHRELGDLFQGNIVELISEYSRLSPALRKSLSQTAKSLAECTSKTP